MITIVKDRQSLLDMAIQCLGSVEAVFVLAASNGLGITDYLSDGQELSWEVADVVNTTVQGVYSTSAIYPTTDITASELQELLSATSISSTSSTGSTDDVEDAVIVDKVDEVLADLAAGNEVTSTSGQSLTRIFEDYFDNTFA